MDLIIEKLLASPLDKALEFLKENDYSYQLKEIEPPYKNKGNLKKEGTKRVLKVKREKKFFEITWSFQYNS